MIGENVRNLRKHRGMKLNDLADVTGLTASYLSQMERGLIEPSITSLRKISSAMEVPMYILLDEEENSPIVIRADKRKIVKNTSEEVYEYISPTIGDGADIKMEVVIFRLQPHCDNGAMLTHHAGECLFVKTGSLVVQLGTSSYNLNEGDSIYIYPNTPHRFCNMTDELAEGISCICI